MTHHDLDVLHASLDEGVAEVLRLGRGLGAPADDADLLDARERLREDVELVAAALHDVPAARIGRAQRAHGVAATAGSGLGAPGRPAGVAELPSHGDPRQGERPGHVGGREPQRIWGSLGLAGDGDGLLLEELGLEVVGSRRSGRHLEARGAASGHAGAPSRLRHRPAGRGGRRRPELSGLAVPRVSRSPPRAGAAANLRSG